MPLLIWVVQVRFSIFSCFLLFILLGQMQYLIYFFCCVTSRNTTNFQCVFISLSMLILYEIRNYIKEVQRAKKSAPEELSKPSRLSVYWSEFTRLTGYVRVIAVVINFTVVIIVVTIITTFLFFCRHYCYGCYLSCSLKLNSNLDFHLHLQAD